MATGFIHISLLFIPNPLRCLAFIVCCGTASFWYRGFKFQKLDILDEMAALLEVGGEQDSRTQV